MFAMGFELIPEETRKIRGPQGRPGARALVRTGCSLWECGAMLAQAGRTTKLLSISPALALVNCSTGRLELASPASAQPERRCSGPLFCYHIMSLPSA